MDTKETGTENETAATSTREGFAMVPSSILESDLTDGEVYVYAALVLIQGAPNPKNDWRPRGAHYIGERIGHQEETVAKHVEKLYERGIVGRSRNENDKFEYEVLYNPAWVHHGTDTPSHVPQVTLGPAPARHHATNKKLKELGLPIPERTDEHRARRNAKDRARRAKNAVPPEAQDGRTASNTTGQSGHAYLSYGMDVPELQDGRTRTTGCPLVLRQAMRGELSTPEVETRGDGTSPSLDSETVVDQDTDKNNDAEPDVIDRAAGHITIGAAREVLATPSARSSLAADPITGEITDGFVVDNVEETSDLTASTESVARTKPTLAAVRHVRSSVRYEAKALRLEDEELYAAIDIILSPDTGTSTLDGLTFDELSRVLAELAETAPLVKARPSTSPQVVVSN